ncbi:pathogenesis-related protein STH-21-like [Lolium rigidum]|uniref:pathogenesis-related protein STH-21-like n=1 Tax=Lolium rigidum TaxID=89674 RepID=UPI001F5C9AB0|nr:pathogenesis-related protein STH-21-like [Lolium rigidum]
MVAGCVITEDCALAVSADRMWKVSCSGDALVKTSTGIFDSVDVEGDGGPGSITTLTLSAAAAAAPGAGGNMVRSRVLVRDDATLVRRNEVLVGSKVSGNLKSQVTEVKFEPAREGACVAKFKVEYERLDGGGALSAEEQAELIGGYIALMKIVETYLVANPAEYA